MTLASGDEWPPVASDWYWKPVSRLPLPTDGKHKHGETQYTARLANLKAYVALDYLAKLLGTD